MSDVELDNKIRLNQVRREAVRKKLKASDGNRSKKDLYGGKEEKSAAKKYVKRLNRKFKPMAAAKNTVKDSVMAITAFTITDVPIYGMALILAFFKDLLDLSVVGALPVIGTVITWCISMAIGLLLLFDGVSGAKRKMARRLTKKMLILIAGTMVEGFLFGLNFLPFEMLTVGIIYALTLIDRKKEKRINKENEE
jgi:hypothetical protein